MQVTTAEIIYPSSDGQPMAESTIQYELIVKIRQFKSEVQQCLMYVHRILQKGFDSQAISSVDC